LGNTVGPAGVIYICNYRPKSRAINAFSQQGIIDSKPQREVGGLLSDSLGHPQDKWLSFNWMQQFPGKPGGFQPTGDNDGKGGHTGVFVIAEPERVRFFANPFNPNLTTHRNGKE
jgi:hypothetical protein